MPCVWVGQKAVLGIRIRHIPPQPLNPLLYKKICIQSFNIIVLDLLSNLASF